MITTSTSVDVQKVIRSGTVTSYTADKVSLFMTHNGEQKRFTADSITNATSNSSGLITFTGVPLWGDGSYSMYITAESDSDLDTNGVQLVRLGTGYIKKITNVETLVI